MKKNNRKLKAVIIEDEEKLGKMLSMQILSGSDDIEISGIFESVRKAIPSIFAHTPDIVFLDIKLKQESGFHLFDYFENQDLPFEVVITTACNEYAIKAMELSAISYLLKPIDSEKLMEAIAKAKKRLATKKNEARYLTLIENLKENNKKIALPIKNGFIVSPVNDILYCKSAGNYTDVHLVSGEKHTINQNLKFYAELLGAFYFFRVNKQFVINFNHIKKFTKGLKWIIEMTDGENIQISELLKDDFLTKFSGE